MPKSLAKRPTYYSESLARGLQVLCAFDREAPRLRIRDVAERTGLNRAATRRFLLTLCDLGYVTCEHDVFFLRPKTLNLGYSYLSSADIRTLIQPSLDELAARMGEAATLAVLDENDALIVARACKRSFDLAIGSGSRLPLDKTALGHVLLASLPEAELDNLLKRNPKMGGSAADRATLRNRLDQVAKAGHAIVQGLLNPQLFGVAVPIHDRSGRPVAALNLTSYTITPNRTAVSKFLRPLSETRTQIEAALRSSDAIPLASSFL